MTFGQSQNNLWIDQPEAVAQLVMTRLRLNLGEWFLDTSDGTPWQTEVLGEQTRWTRDVVVKDRVERTQDVIGIVAYGSRMDPDQRAWSAAVAIDTIYGRVAVGAARLPATVPPLVPQGTAGGSLVNARALGLQGGTPLAATPADLTIMPRSDIKDFEIQTLVAGTW
jgi:hypothetical protein